MPDYIENNAATRMITGATEKERRQNVLLSDRLQLRAREYEKSGELQGALLCWQILSILNPEDQDYSDKFNRLLYESQLLAGQHFDRGLKYFRKNKPESARQEFLTALRYNPDHAESLNYLKHQMSSPAIRLYRIKKGDSLVNIANKIYRDPNKYYLIAVFNDLDVNQQLKIGKELKLPVLAYNLTDPLVDSDGELKKARNQFLNQEYEKVLQSTARILKIDASNTEAAELKNAALYQIAERHRKQQNYLESLETLKKLNPRYKGVQKDITEVKALLKKQAEENYRIGVSYFINDEFDKAIESWEKTLRQNPQHPKARQDIEKARNLLNKLKEVE